VAFADAGFEPGLFWALTPREIAANLEGVRRRLMREHDERMALAWHTAALIRTRKKFPRLKELQSRKEPAAKPRQAWQDQLAIALKWDAAVGPPRWSEATNK
jgi:hypothetical protein